MHFNLNIKTHSNDFLTHPDKIIWLLQRHCTEAFEMLNPLSLMFAATGATMRERKKEEEKGGEYVMSPL